MENIYKGREFKIFNDQNFAKVPTKSPKFICYGCVICHAFYENIKSKKSLKQDFKNSILKMKEYIEKTSPCEIANTLKIYPVLIDKDNKMFGAMLIDETHGCYPLFFSPQANTSSYDRLSALIKILDKITEKSEKLFDLIEESNNWDQIQPDIIALMDHK